MRQLCLFIGAVFCVSSTLVMAKTVPEVVIKQDKNKKFILRKPSAVIVISQKQITMSGATNLSQVLASQSSIQIQDLMGDGTHVSVSMRGFGDNAASNTLIMFNGVPQNNPDVASVNLNRIPLSNVKEIIIMPGGQSVRYGNQAVAGAINIITKTPNKPHASVKVGFGSYMHQIYHFSVSNRYANGFNYLLAGDANSTHNYRRHNHDDERNLLTQLGYQYASGDVSVRYDFYHQHLQYAGALTADQVAENRRQEEPGAPNNYMHDLEHDLAFNWKQLIDKHWYSQTTANLRDYYATGNLYGSYTQDRRVIYINPKAIANYDHGKLTLGTKFTNDMYKLDATNDLDKEHQSTASIYGFWHQPFAKSFAYQVGLRGAGLYDADYHDYAAVSSAALIWHPNADSSVYLRRAGSYRFPKVEENAELVPGISHLKTQTGSSYDLGYKFYIQNWHANINLYYMRLRNEIVFDPTQTASQPFGVNRNLPPTDRRGFNLSLRYTLNDFFTIGGQYSYIDALFRSGNFKGKRIPFVAENTAHLSTSIHFLRYWTWYVETMYMGQRYAAGDDANVGNKINGYVLVNSHIGFRYKRWSASLRVDNIFNHYYSSYVSLVTFDGVATEYFYPAAGRTFMLTAGVDLW